MGPEEQKVLDAVKNMTAHFERGNVKMVMESYEENSAVLFEPQKATIDRNEIEATFKQFSGMNPSYSYAGHQVVVMGDLALHLAPWTMNGKTPDGQELEQKGLSAAVLRKNGQGEWRIVIDDPHAQFLLENAS